MHSWEKLGKTSGCDHLLCISPLDGRYANNVAALREIFSEAGLMRFRLQVEVEWVLHLATEPEFEMLQLPLESDSETETAGTIDEIRHLYRAFSLEDAVAVKEIEKTTRHDVKALELFIKPRLQKLWPQAIGFLHFCCTSDDINSAAYGQALKVGVADVILPAVEAVIAAADHISLEAANAPFLAMTHGQPASTTTFGKEIRVFANRLEHCLTRLRKVEYSAKFGGCVGNFNAHVIVAPQVDWCRVAKSFVEEKLGLTFISVSTQIDPKDNIAELSDTISRINTILVDFSVDMWTYCSRNVLQLRAVKGEVGSSTMPHKVNPIDFENAEGNLGVANALLRFFSAKLPISRMQRDLSESTVLRNLGVAFGHSLVAYNSLARGLARVTFNEVVALAELKNKWELMAEPFQWVLRSYGEDGAYDKLKDATRGTIGVTREGLAKFAAEADLPPDVKERLEILTPETYVGLAGELARQPCRGSSLVIREE